MKNGGLGGDFFTHIASVLSFVRQDS
jgi:hypothetical protein